MFGVVCVGFFSMMLGSVELDVPCYNQYPDYPTACESVATVSMLNYNGFDIGISEFLDNYLDTIELSNSLVSDSENIFDLYFVGNPYSSHGFLCNPPVEVKAVERYFSEINETDASVHQLTGEPFEKIIDEVASGHPVVIWCSINYKDLQRRFLYKSEYMTPSHAAVVSGYNYETGKVTMTDSISGVVDIDYNMVKELYDTYGRKSFVVR